MLESDFCLIHYNVTLLKLYLDIRTMYGKFYCGLRGTGMLEGSSPHGICELYRLSVGYCLTLGNERLELAVTGLNVL